MTPIELRSGLQRATKVAATCARSAYADLGEPTAVGFAVAAAVSNRPTAEGDL